MPQITKILIPTPTENIIITITVEHQPKPVDTYYEESMARQFDE